MTMADEVESLCEECGHLKNNHSARFGCEVIEIADKPYPPWTWQSLLAGQHRPCKCKWKGEDKDKQDKTACK